MAGNFVADGSKHVLGRGAVLFNRFVAGTLAGPGLRFLGNVDELTITTTEDRQEKYSSTEDHSPLSDCVSTRRVVDITATLREFDSPNLALAFGGLFERTSQASGTGAEATFSDVEAGLTYKLPHFNVSGVSVVVGTIEMALNSDYRIELASGLLTVLEDGGIVDGDDVVVTYDHAAIAGINRVKGGVAQQIQGELMFRSDNAVGPNYLLRAWKASVQPEGDTGLIGEDYGSFQVRFRILDDSANHPGEGYYTIETFEGMEVA